MKLPLPAQIAKNIGVKKIRGTVIEDLLKEYGII